MHPSCARQGARGAIHGAVHEAACRARLGAAFMKELEILFPTI